MDCEQLDERFHLMKSEWHSKGELPINVRKRYLKKIYQLIQHNAGEIANAIYEDFGQRAKQETVALEFFPAIQAIKFCHNNVSKWSKPRKKRVSLLYKPASAFLHPQALGVVGNIVPWNYPIYLSLVPAAYALAAGNRVLLKISELTPKTGELLALLITKDFPKHILGVINGDKDVAKHFSTLPFEHLLFTGSGHVAKDVMKAASKNLNPLTLELGGKSPVIVSESSKKADLTRLYSGKCYNAGQTCIAPDYALVARKHANVFEEAAKKFCTHNFPRMPEDDHYTSIISTEHFKRLISLIDDAHEKGARIISLGTIDESKRKIPLTLIFNVTEDMDVMQNELFGPLMPVKIYDTFSDVVQYIQHHPSPLALYYFGYDKEELNWLKQKTLSGALVINDTIMHVAIDDLPFGGVGESGFGCYHGQEGFDRFSQLKPVFKQKKIAPITWFYPLHRKVVYYLLTKLARLKMK